MNIKQILGGFLTILGIGGIAYSAILFLNGTSGKHDVKSLIVYAILGFVFFSAGIKLVGTIRE
jgi:hypothetical protein